METPSGAHQSCRDARRIRQPGDDRGRRRGAAPRRDWWLTGAPPWLALFQRWLAEAVAARIPEPNAMVVGTVDADGVPATRTVLCKGAAAPVSRSSPATSRPKGSPWPPTRSVADVSVDRAGPPGPLPRCRPQGRRRRDAGVLGFASARPRGSRLASSQSSPIAGRAELRSSPRPPRRGSGRRRRRPVPVPPHWGGYLSMPGRTRSSGRVAPTACTTV